MIVCREYHYKQRSINSVYGLTEEIFVSSFLKLRTAIQIHEKLCVASSNLALPTLKLWGDSSVGRAKVVKKPKFVFILFVRYAQESYGDVMSLVEAEQVNVTKHFKISNSKVRLDIHNTKEGIGIWLTPRNSFPGNNTIGMYSDERATYFMVWPKYKSHLPFTISTEGIQIPLKDGKVKFISLEQVSDFVSKLDI